MRKRYPLEVDLEQEDVLQYELLTFELFLHQHLLCPVHWRIERKLPFGKRWMSSLELRRAGLKLDGVGIH